MQPLSDGAITMIEWCNRLALTITLHAASDPGLFSGRISLHFLGYCPHVSCASFTFTFTIDFLLPLALSPSTSGKLCHGGAGGNVAWGRPTKRRGGFRILILVQVLDQWIDLVVEHCDYGVVWDNDKV